MTQTQNIISVTVSTAAISLTKFGRKKKVVTTYFTLNLLEGIKKELIHIISIHFQAEKTVSTAGDILILHEILTAKI